jgi:hypothetical protein
LVRNFSRSITFTTSPCGEGANVCTSQCVLLSLSLPPPPPPFTRLSRTKMRTSGSSSGLFTPSGPRPLSRPPNGIDLPCITKDIASGLGFRVLGLAGIWRGDLFGGGFRGSCRCIHLRLMTPQL